jgi:hypothetical protein
MVRNKFEKSGGVYTFSEAKPYYRVKKNGKWTWVAAELIYSGWDNYVIRKIRDVPPSGLPKTVPEKHGEAKEGVQMAQTTTEPVDEQESCSEKESPQ